MEISVIICTFNRDKFLGFALQSLLNQSINLDAFEIILINNNSTDSTDSICRDFKNNNVHVNITYDIETKQGLSFARNRGINLAKGEIIVFLDDDAIACKDYLETILVFFKKNLNVSAFGGKILPKYEYEAPKWISSYIISLFSVIDLGNIEKVFPRNKYPIGANMGFRKQIFEKYGTFNTSLGRKGIELIGGEEKDLFYRLLNGKENIYYIANAWVYHIIPKERTLISHIKKQAVGIGFSEKLRLKQLSFLLKLERYILEIFKWTGTFALFFYYTLTFQPSKGIILIRFRSWVSMGLFFGKNN